MHDRVTAIVRTTRFDAVVEALCRIGVPGLTATRVAGLGEYRNYFCRDPMVDHLRVELFVDESRTEEVVTAIVTAAQTGTCGDGVVAVARVERIVRIRTGEPCA